jgi:mono/diheme cytochrome c family protein
VKGFRGYLIVAVVVGAFISGLKLLSRRDLGQRNVEIFTEMVYSKAAESFTASPSLPGGVTQQQLVAGVVPRGPLPLRYGTGEEEAQRAGRELASPFAADDAAALATGRKLYGVYCVLCHDPGGNGQGTVVRHGMLPPPSLHAVRAAQMTDGQMFHILTYGQGNMASYAAQLTREERWQAILYVRKLQKESQQ